MRVSAKTTLVIFCVCFVPAVARTDVGLPLVAVFLPPLWLTTKKLLEKEVTSWNELRDSLKELANAGWAFRGQANASWQLESSLTRYLKNFGGPPDEWVAREKRSLHAFKRKAHILLPRTPEEGETLEWLALMQHHGGLHAFSILVGPLM